MGLASIRVIVLGTISFSVFWTLAVFPAFKLLPIGRTAGALAGAVLTVVFNVETPNEAYSAVDLRIISLLFGTMMISVYLEKADMFRYLGQVLSWKSQGGKDLLCRVCVLSAISSALFTNDTCCLVLTEFVLKLCSQKNIPPKPFLLALATSANIGSVATPIGNPQNLVIAVQSGIPFGKFLMGLLGPMLLGVVLNTSLLLLTYWKQLSSLGIATRHDILHSNAMQTATPWAPFHSGSLFAQQGANFDEEALRSQLKSLGFPSLQDSSNNALREDSETAAIMQDLESNPAPILKLLKSGTLQDPLSPTWTSKLLRKESHFGPHIVKASGSQWPRWRSGIWKFCVYFVTAAMLGAFLYGLDMAWTALTAAVALMALDYCDAGPHLQKVSYPLLVFFVGMFISVDGFNTTGIPHAFWDLVEPHAQITNMLGEVVLTLVVIILSNVASNVPTVLLLGSQVASSALHSGGNVAKAWLILAWASTVAGNLTLVGSAANLIVSEQAAKNQLLSFDLTFFSHLTFGFPSTLIVAICGLFIIKA